MMAHDRKETREALEPSEDLLAEDRVALEHRALVGRELARLREDRGGKARVPDVAEQRAKADGHPGRFIQSERAADLDGACRDSLAVPGAGPVVSTDRRSEHDERLGRRLEVVIEPALANQQVDDPRKLRVDRDHLVPVGATAAGAHANHGDVLGQVSGDGGISLDEHDVGRLARVREVETRLPQLLNVLVQCRVGDRDARHETLTGRALDRTAESRGPRVPRLTEYGVDSREELRGLERFGDVVRGAARETTDLVDDLATGRREEDRGW